MIWKSFFPVFRGERKTVNYRMRSKNGDWVELRTTSFLLLNPYTDAVESIVCTNTLFR